MTIKFSTKNINLSPALMARCKRKVEKLDRYFKNDVEANVRLRMEKGNRNICEISIPFYDAMFRGEASAENMYMAIDNALEKVERQVHRNKEKWANRFRDAAFTDMPEFAIEYAEETQTPGIARYKTYSSKPMGVEDAIDQLLLLGHAFFVFVNIETDETCVVYQRRDGAFGLLEPDK